MKTSISVPDELWDQACALTGVGRYNVSPSALVQVALRDYIEKTLRMQVEDSGGFEVSVSFS